MYRARTRSSSTTNRYIYRSNRYIESIYSIRPPGREGDTLNTRSYTRNEGPLKGHCAKAYKLRDPSPTGYREGIRNMGATIIISGEPAPRRESAVKAVEDRRLLI